MAKEKTISQKLRELADWLEAYEKWYREYQQNASTEDEGGQPGGPPPPPPPGGGFGGN